MAAPLQSSNSRLYGANSVEPFPSSAAEKFFHKDSPLPFRLGLRFLPVKELALLASTSRAFSCNYSEVALEALYSTDILAINELAIKKIEMFVKIVTHKKKPLDLKEISLHLENLRGLDFSNCNFAETSFGYLRMLPEKVRLQIRTLKFNSAQNLTMKKLKLLITSAENKILFPYLSVIDFTGTNLRLNFTKLLNEIPFLKNGRGKVTFSSGKMHEGCFLNGRKDGQGILTDPRGFKHEGTWQDDELVGPCKIIYQTGDIYEGEQVKGQKNGYGIHTTSKGNKYEGTWVDQQLSGPGSLTFSNGLKYEGKWFEGKLIGKFTITSPDGKKSVGHWSEGEVIQESIHTP